MLENFRIVRHNIKKVYVVIITSFFSLSAFGTAQVGDILIWKGDTFILFSNPLEFRADYYSLSVQISNEIERATYPEEDNDEERKTYISTACWRGYVAEWIILNDSIFLNNIYDCHNENIKVNLKNIFPSIGKNQKIFASWIKEDLYIPQGECIQYIHFGYKSIFERETVLNIENGLLKNYEIFHNRILKRSNFFERGHTPEFTSRNINWKILPDLSNMYIQVFVGVQPNEQGQFESVDEEYTYLIEYPLNDSTSTVNFVTDTNNIFIKESIRIAKLIPEWTVIYQRGKIVGMSLMVIFSEENRKKYVQ